jgi:glycosyltransferase involved in cell wall biosynthesis
MGENNENEKIAFYQNAKAMLFTSTHQEGCPMVVLESLSCGTPVIAYDNSIMKEIIIDGKHGFICHNKEDMYSAINKINKMSELEYRKMRKDCRQLILDRFTTEIMCDKYVDIFKKVIPQSERLD